MKQGASNLQELAVELDRQTKSKRDFLASPQAITMTKESSNEARIDLEVAGKRLSFEIGETAHDQISARLGIPKRYYDRMLAEESDLLSLNVNTWLKKEKEPRLVRTLDNRVRAFLSDRYRPLDNYDLAETVFPILSEQSCGIASCALTEKRMYIKAVNDLMTMDVKVGDPVQAGIVISNSEIGLGSVKVEPMILRLVCKNGMIASDHSLRKYHIGKSGNTEQDLADELFTDETRKADDRAFWLKVRDVVRGAFRKDIFEKLVARMKEATGNRITGSLEKSAEVIQKKFSLQDGEKDGVLNYLITGGDLSQYGLMNAFTRQSQDIQSYDRATEFERFGGIVLELPKSEWREIAEAA